MIGLFFGSLFAAFAPNMTILIILREIMGFGLGAELVVGFGTFAEFVPAKTRGKWTSTLSFLANTVPPLATQIGMESVDGGIYERYIHQK